MTRSVSIDCESFVINNVFRNNVLDSQSNEDEIFRSLLVDIIPSFI